MLGILPICYIPNKCKKYSSLRSAASSRGILEAICILVLNYVTAFKFDGFSLHLLKGSFYRQFFFMETIPHGRRIFSGVQGRNFPLHQALKESVPAGPRVCWYPSMVHSMRIGSPPSPLQYRAGKYIFVPTENLSIWQSRLR
ncbi:uncharacterized protein LOC110028922 isoform X1 [Phalaenopsis equestris]|uniref:uncharacterized protein LOC110028922 isoform X1 n=1 Tax=Phalaenopsis equestris TaxID=78828 RepID=UPI0009E2EABE|nr:uncharacterized protein LOC110028922 isoform X1 [Phalaenopsis equestris]